MRNSRHVLSALAIAAAVSVPSSMVQASTVQASTVRAATDMNDTIRQLAADAAELVAEEQALLAIAQPDATGSEYRVGNRAE